MYRMGSKQETGERGYPETRVAGKRLFPGDVLSTYPKDVAIVDVPCALLAAIPAAPDMREWQRGCTHALHIRLLLKRTEMCLALCTNAVLRAPHTTTTTQPV